MSRAREESSSALSGKEPWLAVNLSMFFPGIGQIYAGDVRKGLILIIGQILLVGLGGWLIVSPKSNTGIGLILLCAALFVHIWNFFDAHKCARKANSLSVEESRKSDKDPWLAVFLSRIIPGVGHLYIKKPLIGILLFVGFLLAVFLPIISIIVYTLIACHAYLASPVHRERTKRPIIIFTIFLILSLAWDDFQRYFIKNFVLESRYIPAGSMLPTLQINDRLIIDKWGYRFQEPQRGEIVVFLPTEKLRQQSFKDAFIKRIIGMPGEKVEVKGGKVYINNKVLEENYIEEPPNYSFGSVTVPPNSYFVLGDNRNNSYDSHYWGFVPRANIIGKATKRYWPLNRSSEIK